MIIQLKSNISNTELENLLNTLEKFNIKAKQITTQYRSYIVGISSHDVDLRYIGSLAGVEDVHKVKQATKLVSKEWKTNSSAIDIGNGITVGNGHFTTMAGPCSIESEDQIESIVKHLLENNIKVMRGGVFKPRSSPYAFRGLGLEGLKLFYKHCSSNGIKIITEIMEISQLEEMMDYVDIFQVGARNSQNFNLLDVLGEVDKPILLKRGISGTIDELLASAEYVFSNGNEKIILCERGIRTFEKAYRNTLDLNAVPILKERSHLPVIVDPSHGIGLRNHVPTMALSSILAGADGLILEVHQTPEKAYSDGQQTLNFTEANNLYKNIEKTLALKKEFIY